MESTGVSFRVRKPDNLPTLEIDHAHAKTPRIFQGPVVIEAEPAAIPPW